MRDLAHVNLLLDAERKLFSGRQGKLRRLRALEFATMIFLTAIEKLVPSGNDRNTVKRYIWRAVQVAAEAIQEENQP